MDARRQLLHRGFATGTIENAVNVAGQQVETVVTLRLYSDVLEVFARLLIRHKKVAHQSTARRRIGFALARIAKICQCRKTTPTRYAQPGAHALQVAAGKYVRMVLP